MFYVFYHTHTHTQKKKPSIIYNKPTGEWNSKGLSLSQLYMSEMFKILYLIWIFYLN